MKLLFNEPIAQAERKRTKNRNRIIGFSLCETKVLNSCLIVALHPAYTNSWLCLSQYIPDPTKKTLHHIAT